MSEVLKKVPTDEVVETLYNDLRRRISDIEPNDAMVAPDYADLTLPILVGTRCTHNRGLYKCNTQINSSEAWDSTHWDEITVGSELDSLQSEVDDKYEKPSGGIPASDLADGVIPTVPVQDVQVNGTSILENGVANIPESDSNTLGVVMIGDGLSKNAITGRTNVQFASDSFIKLGGSSTQAISPARQHTSVFYGLTKAAGVDMSSSANAVGTYTDPAKQAIQKMLGLAGLLGPYEDDITADQAYAVGETFVMDGKRYRVTSAISQGGVITPGTNCELDPLDGRYVKDTDVASTSKSGLSRVSNSYGTQIINSLYMGIYPASSGDIKRADNSNGGTYRPVTPKLQHESVYYALAKLAGADMASLTGETVGVYPQTQKAAIQTMLGIEADVPLIEEVSGSTPSITGMPNVRYICGTVSTLSITPPASGSIVVRFTSGSTATVLTVPNTVKFPEWFDYTELEADTVYEVIITDGVYGGVMSWVS